MKLSFELELSDAESECLGVEVANIAKILKSEGDKIMSAISDFAQKVQQNFTEIKNGILALDAKITELQNTPDPITASDQALLDDIVAQSGALAMAASTFPPPQPPVA